MYFCILQFRLKLQSPESYHARGLSTESQPQAQTRDPKGRSVPGIQPPNVWSPVESKAVAFPLHPPVLYRGGRGKHGQPGSATDGNFEEAQHSEAGTRTNHRDTDTPICGMILGSWFSQTTQGSFSVCEERTSRPRKPEPKRHGHRHQGWSRGQRITGSTCPKQLLLFQSYV